MTSSPESSKQELMACDQCYTNRTKCNRVSPVCQSCTSRKLPCSWNREAVCRHYHSYQNVETFSVQIADTVPKNSSPGKVAFLQFEFGDKKDLHRPSNLGLENKLKLRSKHRSSIEKSACRIVTKKMNKKTFKEVSIPYKDTTLFSSWSLVLKKWHSTSYLRVYFYSLVRFSGICLSKTSPQDQALLTELLLNRLCLRHEPFKPAFPLILSHFEAMPLLQLATEAFFHYFNPYNTLFTKQGFEAQPRSPLLNCAIWRIGLSFLPESPIKTSLLEWIDSQLSELTRASRVKVCLDTLQSYLILIFNMDGSPLKSRRGFFHGAALSMVYCLGLHQPAWRSPLLKGLSLQQHLEGLLAYRLVMLYNFICAMRLGSHHFTLGNFNNPYLRFPPKIYAFYQKQALNNNYLPKVQAIPPHSIHQPIYKLKVEFPEKILGVQTDNFVWEATSRFQFQSFLKGSNLSAGLAPSASDFCILISNQCLFEETHLLRELQYSRLHVTNLCKPGQSLYPQLRSALRTIKRAFFLRGAHLEKLKNSKQGQNSFSSVQMVGFDYLSIFNTDLRPDYPTNIAENHRALSDPTIRVIVETQLFLAIHYHFSRLMILEIASHIDPLNPGAELSPRPLRGFVSRDITAGIYSAIQLITLLYQVNPGPFQFVRLSFLSSASQFLIRHYHTYAHLTQFNNFNQLNIGVDPSSTFLPPLTKLLQRALLWTRHILIASLDCPFTGNQARIFLTMFDIILNSESISLAPSA